MLFNPHLTDGVKRLQAASRMIKTAAGILGEPLPGSAGRTTGELLLIRSYGGEKQGFVKLTGFLVCRRLHDFIAADCWGTEI